MQPDPAASARTPRSRLFFALMPGPAERQSMAKTVDALVASQSLGGRRSDPARYHLTLQYLGEFEPLTAPLLDAACEAGDAIAGAQQPFELEIDRVGCFGSGRDWLWWLGPASPPAELQMLHERLAEALRRRGVTVPPTRGFRPHATVLRRAQQPPATDHMDPLRWRVDAFTLVSSAAEGAPGYSRLAEWPLGGAPAHSRVADVAHGRGTA